MHSLYWLFGVVGSTAVFMSFPSTWMITVLAPFRGELLDRKADCSTRKGAYVSSAVTVESTPFYFPRVRVTDKKNVHKFPR